MPTTNGEILKLLEMIEESDFDEVKVECGDLKVHVRKYGTPQSLTAASHAEAKIDVGARQTTPQALPANARLAPSEPKQAVPQEIPDGLLALRAPMLGTFYRAAAPGEKPFVEVGDAVGSNDTVCLVEVMKLFNSVKAGVSGTVVKVMAENGAMVEFGQVLMLIEPR